MPLTINLTDVVGSSGDIGYIPYTVANDKLGNSPLKIVDGKIVNDGYYISADGKTIITTQAGVAQIYVTDGVTSVSLSEYQNTFARLYFGGANVAQVDLTDTSSHVSHTNLIDLDAPNVKLTQESSGGILWLDSSYNIKPLPQTTYPSPNELSYVKGITRSLSSDIWTTVVLASDVTNNNATPDTMQDVTGLSFSVVAGTYAFEATIMYTSAATTTGSRWGINGSVAATQIAYRTFTPLNAGSTSPLFAAAYDAGAASATSASTSANLATINGIVTVGGSGTITVRFASEVSGSAIVAKAGSILKYKKVL